jgi:hypothetical protein
VRVNELHVNMCVLCECPICQHPMCVVCTYSSIGHRYPDVGLHCVGC